MDIKQKILISGDVRGNFKQLFNRVDSINKKSGPFEFLLCVGDFFNDNNPELEAYRNGNKFVPIPTYILGPNNEKHTTFYQNLENDEICTNLTYLGKRGLYTVSSGIKVAYLSGIKSDGKSIEEFTFNEEDVKAVKNSCIVNKSTVGDYRGVDILITSQGPEGIDKKITNCSKLISWLTTQIRPRYHFSGLNGIYYERQPYRVPAGTNTQLELATRFISLANVGNPEKNKYIYALSITPVDKMRLTDLIQKTTDETECPYNDNDFSELKIIQKKENASQFFYDMESYGDSNFRFNKRKGNYGTSFKEKRQRPDFDQEKCWFCLSSPNVEKHLVISIGDNFYLALAKGPINETHVLILSITHIQSVSLLSESDFQELEKFKKVLTEYFASKNKVVCFFERNYKSSHLQVNAVAIESNIEWQIKHGFEDKAEEYNIELETIPKITESTQLPQQGPYFAAQLPDNATLLTRQMKHFPLHFGREVLCSENLLNCEDKIDWKECSLSKDEENTLVDKFRNEFKPFDFTL